jgi:hypothetical protein
VEKVTVWVVIGNQTDVKVDGFEAQFEEVSLYVDGTIDFNEFHSSDSFEFASDSRLHVDVVLRLHCEDLSKCDATAHKFEYAHTTWRGFL